MTTRALPASRGLEGVDRVGEWPLGIVSARQYGAMPPRALERLPLTSTVIARTACRRRERPADLKHLHGKRLSPPLEGNGTCALLLLLKRWTRASQWPMARRLGGEARVFAQGISNSAKRQAF